MPYGFEPIKIERFGGLNTLVDPTNLPNFASPDCSDIEFLPGLVRTRPGLTSLFTALGGNPTVNYLKSYITPAAALRALALDSIGNLYKENPIGTLALIGQIENSGMYGNSVSLFGREYIAFGDGKIGAAIPRQFDDTNFDRVSQIGPAQAPGATDENISFALTASPNGAIAASTAIAAGPNGLTQSGFVVTVKTSLISGYLGYLRAGDSFQVTGAGVGGYNGTWTVSAVIDQVTLQYINTVSGLAASGGGTLNLPLASYLPLSGATPVDYIDGQLLNVAGVGVAAYNSNGQIVRQNTFLPGKIPAGTGSITIFAGSAVFGAANSGGGTITNGGSIIAGVHKVSVIFVTRQGYLTAPAKSTSWTSAGNKRAVISPIPIGPANVVSRIIVFTAAGGASFFYTGSSSVLVSGSMVIPDNTTTTATVDFSDATLLSGVNVDALFNLLELGECSGATQYSSRLFWWGERNKVNSNGGNGFTNLTFDGGFTGTVPYGWVADTGFQTGAALSTVAAWGNSYTIGGDGATAIRGRIFQTAYQDSFGNPIIQPNVAYSARVRIQHNGVTQGNFIIELFSPTQGSIGIFSTAISTMPNGKFGESIGVLCTAQASIPSDIILRIYANGTINAGASMWADNIEIFPTNNPVNATVVRVSKIEDPESYDGVTGFLQIGENNGQAVRTGFVIRNNLYFAKERSLYVTQDDGVNEPNQWMVQEISQKVGTLSVRGVGLGDEWAIIAGIDGVYYFDGGEPQKISQEVQPTWDSINWSLGHLIDVKVDTKRKRAYIAVPLGASATANNRVLTLDFTDGFGDPNPTNTVNIAGIGRKWSPWAIACNSMNFILRSDGSQQLWLGNQVGNGKIYQLDATGTVFTDDGAKINDYWQSGYFQGTGRMLFGIIAANVTGVGTMNLLLRKGDQKWVTNIRGWLMSSFGFRNMERNINIETERLSLRFASAGTGDHFSLQGVALYARESVFAELRGINA